MGYCDYTDAWLRDLTRQRRGEKSTPAVEFQRTGNWGDAYMAYYAKQAAKARAVRPETVYYRPRIPQPKRYGGRSGYTYWLYNGKPDLLTLGLGSKSYAKTSNMIMLVEAQAGKCYLCGDAMDDLDDPATMEHVRSRHKGGHDSRNRLAAHESCNQHKAFREPFPCELLYRDAIYLKLGDREVTPQNSPVLLTLTLSDPT